MNIIVNGQWTTFATLVLFAMFLIFSFAKVSLAKSYHPGQNTPHSFIHRPAGESNAQIGVIEKLNSEKKSKLK